MRVIPKHLTTGSTKPPLVEGKLRLYSMEYCPFAQRVRLVLRAKNIPHDIVNINLINKPEWYFEVNPKGLVPALETPSEVLVESLDVVNWLDENYPQNPLYPSDPDAKQRDKALISKFGEFISIFSKNLANETTPEEVAKELRPYYELIENELASRGTFLGGDKPAMVDYMLWPWAERAGIFNKIFQTKLYGPSEFPQLRQWKEALLKDEAIAATVNDLDSFWKIVQMKFKKIPPNYDDIAQSA